MQTAEQAIIRFFEQVAQKDEDQMNRLKQTRRFHMEQDRWCFTLPDLHAFLQRQNAVFRPIGYKQFRKLIFNSPINTTVKRFGAEITIIDNRGKVDQSGYVLIWRSSDPEPDQSREGAGDKGWE